MVQEMRIALRNLGKVDPASIDDYISLGGYQALDKARGMEQGDLISMLEHSGKLRGRGGAAFNTGLKWSSAYEVEADEKYVICNADEGEPGTYKDRTILESDPHSIIEGILICAYAIGAKNCYIYSRGEYTEQIKLLKRAIQQTEARDLCHGVTIRVVAGAGSYVCGEETALIESLEGKRGEPRLKPPFPTVAGFRGKPTVVNNVETLATVPIIVEKGSEWFKAIGAPQYPGTKVFSLSGDIVNKTCFEVPTNATIREIIYELGGGIPGGRQLKAVQVGGSSCGFLTPDQLDIPVDFESMREIGSALGSGAVLVIDDRHNLVDILVGIAHFFEHESCGKCTACREGTHHVAKLIEKIANGTGTVQDLELIRNLAKYMDKTCFCPLGQSATTAISSAMKSFESDFLDKMKA